LPHLQRLCCRGNRDGLSLFYLIATFDWPLIL
jgi:hypothetical protein